MSGRHRLHYGEYKPFPLSWSILYNSLESAGGPRESTARKDR